MCSVPVEPVGSQLRRGRSEGPMPINPKVGIVSIILYLLQQGIDEENVDFYDIDMLYPSDEEIIAHLQSKKPDVIGLSGVVSTSYQQIKRVSKIAKEILPNVVVVVGGGITAAYKVILNKTDVDYCVKGDGEIAFHKIVEALESGDTDKIKEIPGVAYLEGSDAYIKGMGEQQQAKNIEYHSLKWIKNGLDNKDDLINNYVRPARMSGLFSLDHRVDDFIDLPLATIYTTKGCVARCTFCQRASKGYRTIPIEDIREYLVTLINEFGIKFINISDENWGSNREHAYRVADLMSELGLYWAATGVRVTSVNYEDLDYYYNHNCSCLKFGVESGSQDILDVMEKKFNVDQVYTCLTNCMKIGIHSPMALMIGMPGESNKTILETGEFIGKVSSRLGVHPNDMFMDIFYALPLLDTPLYEYGVINGIIANNLDEEESYLNALANSAAYKRYYINLSGQSIKDVVSWDVMMKMHASRVFNKMSKSKEKSVNPSVRDRLLAHKRMLAKKNPHVSLANKNLISRSIDRWVIGNEFFDQIPAIILYPIIRLLLYVEYIIDKLTNRYDTFLFDEKYAVKINPLHLKSPDSKHSKKKRSLRTIVSNIINNTVKA